MRTYPSVHNYHKSVTITPLSLSLSLCGLSLCGPSPRRNWLASNGGATTSAVEANMGRWSRPRHRTTRCCAATRAAYRPTCCACGGARSSPTPRSSGSSGGARNPIWPMSSTTSWKVSPVFRSSFSLFLFLSTFLSVLLSLFALSSSLALSLSLSLFLSVCFLLSFIVLLSLSPFPSIFLSLSVPLPPLLSLSLPLSLSLLCLSSSLFPHFCCYPPKSCMVMWGLRWKWLDATRTSLPCVGLFWNYLWAGDDIVSEPVAALPCPSILLNAPTFNMWRFHELIWLRYNGGHFSSFVVPVVVSQESRKYSVCRHLLFFVNRAYFTYWFLHCILETHRAQWVSYLHMKYNCISKRAV